MQKSETDGLIHLNTSMASDGLFIYIPEGVNYDQTCTGCKPDSIR